MYVLHVLYVCHECIYCMYAMNVCIVYTIYCLFVCMYVCILMQFPVESIIVVKYSTYLLCFYTTLCHCQFCRQI